MYSPKKSPKNSALNALNNPYSNYVKNDSKIVETTEQSPMTS